MGMAVSKLIAGFLLGVFVTLAVVFWLDGKSPEMQANLTGQSSLPEEAAEVQRANPMKRIDEAAKEDGEELNRSTSSEAVSYAEPLALQAESIVTPPPTSLQIILPFLTNSCICPVQEA